MRKKFEKWLLKLHDSHPSIKLFIAIYYYSFGRPLDYIYSYFEKDVRLHVQKRITIDYQHIPDTIRGSVINGRKVYLFEDVPYEEIDRLIETLERSNDKIQFEITYGGGWYQDILLTPKLRKLMRERLKEIRNEHGVPNTDA